VTVDPITITVTMPLDTPGARQSAALALGFPDWKALQEALDPTAFANARLDEEQAAAVDAGSGSWRAEAWHDGRSAPDGRPLRADIWEHSTLHRITHWGGQVDIRDGAHIVLQDPASVLRDIEGKRAIVEDYRTACSLVGGTEHAAIREVLEVAVRRLMLKWADHPDYNQAWKP
jgi:hypothetical protein